MVSKIIKLYFLLHVSLALTHVAGELCAEFGGVRIIERRKYPQVCDTSTDGQLAWLYICNNAWDVNEADVFCKQLGFTGSEGRVSSAKKKGNNEIKVSNLMCNSSRHKRIVDCPHIAIRRKCNYVANMECRRCDNNGQCSGGLCDTNTGQCHCNSACNRGDVCIAGRCECINGISGANCDSTCEPSCVNGGVCNSTSQCECPPPYYGDTCQYKDCQFPCLNNGTCLSNGRCQCPAMYHGEGCEFKSCSPSCPVESLCDKNGTCETPTNIATIRTEDNDGIAATEPTLLPMNTKLVLYSSVTAVLVCLVLSCTGALVIAALAWRVCMRGGALRKDEVYEDMASLQDSQLVDSANSIEYDSNVWPHRISPYLVVGDESTYDSPIPYYATVGCADNDYDYVEVAQCEYPAYVNTCEDIHTPYLIT